MHNIINFLAINARPFGFLIYATAFFFLTKGLVINQNIDPDEISNTENNMQIKKANKYVRTGIVLLLIDFIFNMIAHIHI